MSASTAKPAQGITDEDIAEAASRASHLASASATPAEIPELMPERSVDPRILRTRKLLQQALVKLMEKKEFDAISVQDIAEQATINRATFYDHYTDKFALLECTVGSRFMELLAERGVTFNGSCSSALKAFILGVCDFIASAQLPSCERPGQLEPHMESAIIAVVRRMLLDGLEKHPSNQPLSPQMIATTASWAIYGAAREWAQTPNRPPSIDIVETILTLVSPLLALAETTPHAPSQPAPSDR
ncbi:TetR/AcrR family transcriptional regulator [Tunturiibacter gelidoferens]|uniref:AcrR family transcriptional regulator n=1 Tax=Tunturiibacter gelidiferens TaxID=3069689 RepID=A0A9X0Q9S5_9BACT|nr:TetR/AcrR family transcriptional regulator [Edaphobacter lichenicola]MBB5326432.1 AcrR family transcriptional regulator [Edaphobacter lichenicola]